LESDATSIRQWQSIDSGDGPLLLTHGNYNLSISNEDSATATPTVRDHDWMISVTVEEYDVARTMSRHGHD
jgi:hypothetical protein